jgi:hypothetical protein
MSEQDFSNRWDFAIGSKEMRLLKDLREQDFTFEQIDIVFTSMKEYAVEPTDWNVLEEKDYEEMV